MHRAAALILAFLLAGCLTGGPAPVPVDGWPDHPMHRVLDAYYDVAPNGTYLEHSARHAGGGTTSGSLRFHSLDEVAAKLAAWERDYPALVEVRILGQSRQGRPLWDVVVTDESVPATGKLAPILDGAHHGNEYAGGEVMLYTIDTLLENWATNATVRGLLRSLEVHVVPIVNPDGWVAATRYNAAGVNLNRNYDVDWGNAAGTSNPVMGTVGAASGQPFGGVLLVAENCGATAFSEPETQAMRGLFASLKGHVAFYLSGHTPSHAVIAPWAAFQPPFPLPAEHGPVLEQELQWIRDHTEYQAGKAAWGNLSAGLPYAASGSSMDYLYMTEGKPAFTVEVEYYATSATSPDYPQRLAESYAGLRYWMDATLPIPMHLLANAEALAHWQAPLRPALAPALTLEQHPPRPAWLPGPDGEPHLD